MKLSSVSPERWLITALYPERWARRMASRVSERVPIWFTLTRMALATPRSIPARSLSGLVTKRSSPTSWTFPPRRSVRSRHPSQSSSARPSSMERMGYFSTQASQKATISSEERTLPSPSRWYFPSR